MTNKAKTVKSQGKNPNQSIKPAYGLGFTSGNLQAQFAVNDADFQKHKYEKLARLAWFSENEEPQKVSQKVIEAIRLYESLAPEDGVEAIMRAGGWKSVDTVSRYQEQSHQNVWI